MAGGFLGTPGVQWITNQTSIAIGVSGKPIRIYDAIVISGATASTLQLFNGIDTTSGQFIQIDGIINKSSQLPLSSEQGIRFSNGCFASVDSNATVVMISFEQEF